MRRAPTFVFTRSALDAALIVILSVAACGPKTPPEVAPVQPVTAASAPAPLGVRALPAEFDRIFGTPAFDRMQWGVIVQSLDSGRVLYERNATKLMMPASNMKIVTLAAAAERLGWDYTWETRLIPTGPIEGGTLRGDLVVAGTGDPTINGRSGSPTAVFERWAETLSAGGLRRIEGRIVADASAFDAEGLGAGWAWDYLGAGYAAPVSALQFNEDVVDVLVRPGAVEGAPALVAVRQVESGLEVDNRVVTGPGDAVLFSVRRLPGSNTLHLAGTIGVAAKEAVRTATVESPGLFFAGVLRRVLREKGIDVIGPALGLEELPVRPVVDGARALIVHKSPPLSEAAAVLMKVSQNLYAETFLKTLGAGAAAPGSAAAGQDVVRSVLQGWGVAPEEYVLADGSGLSRYNYVTPQMLVKVLRRLYLDARHRDAFISTLPVGGQDGGTIAKRFKGTKAEGNVRAKTGTISNVRALSGYVTTLDGERLVFSIIANNFTAPTETIDAATDLAVERLANTVLSGPER
jgi:D-alanyl-D-alanine carboxypeptidase/D-alanyl-D-alanine-endopeptidase (penicillin-binding protein 4)